MIKSLKKYTNSSTFLTSIVVLLVGTYPAVRIWYSFRQVEAVAEFDLPIIEVLTNIEIHQLEQSVNLERAIRHAYHQQGSDDAYLEFKEKFKALSLSVDNELIQARNEILKAVRHTSDEDQLQALDFLRISLEELVKEHHQYEENALDLLNRLNTEDLSEDLNMLTTEVARQEDAFNTQVESVLLHFEFFTENEMKELESQERISLLTVETITIIGFTVALIGIYFYHRSVVRQMNEMENYIVQYSRGNVKPDVSIDSHPSADEIKKALKSMALRTYRAKKMIDDQKKLIFGLTKKMDRAIAELKESVGGLATFKSENMSFNLYLENAIKALDKVKQGFDAIKNATAKKEK